MASQAPAPERPPFEENAQAPAQPQTDSKPLQDRTETPQDNDTMIVESTTTTTALEIADAAGPTLSQVIDAAPSAPLPTATEAVIKQDTVTEVTEGGPNTAVVSTAIDTLAVANDPSPPKSPLHTEPTETADPTASSTEVPQSQPNPIATTSVPPPIEQPTSDVRDDAILEQPPPREESSVKSEAPADTVDAMDTTEPTPRATVAESTPNGTGDHSRPSHPESAPPAAEVGREDTSMIDTPPVEATEKPAVEKSPSAPAPADAATAGNADATMADVSAPSKVRAREDEDDAEPAAKRAKTEEGSIPVAPHPADAPKADVAMTEAPAAPPATPVAAPATNGTPQTALPPAATPTFAEEIMAKKDFDPNPISDAQHRYLQESLRKAKKIKAGASFSEPVDPVKLNIPTYFDFIKQPMDLSTIEKKLREREYTSTDHLMSDFDLMVRNCMVFNGPNHAVTLAGYDLKAYFVKLLNVMPKSGDPVPAPKKLLKPPTAPTRPSQPRRESRTKASPPAPPLTAASMASSASGHAAPHAASPPASGAFALKPDGLPLIRRDSAATDRPKREIHRPPSKDLIYNQPKPKGKKAAELQFAEQVINEFHKPRYEAVASPFYYEVDPVALQIPMYHKVIKKPMDLGTIKRNLEQGHYANAKDVYRDVKLMVANCYKFNGDDHPVSRAGKELEKYFEDEWSKLDDYVAKNTPASPVEVEASDEEEEEEEETEDPVAWMARKMEEVNAVQSEMQALAARQVELQKRQTALLAEISAGAPKVTGKKGKSKKPKSEGGARGGKRASGVGVKDDKKKPGASKPKKIPTLGLQHKTEISNYIDTLTDNDRVQEVLSIIKAGMPSVANLDTQEIELDIDQIPNNVLYDLYVYICKSRGEKPNFGSSASRASAVDDGAYLRDLEDDDFVPRKKSGGGRRRKAGSGGADGEGGTTTHRKKNKPMKPAEQEARISEIKQALGGFSANGAPSHGVMQSVEGMGPESSSEEDSDDESESEEE